jgi:ATP-dependent RNA helicase DeaD
MDTKGIKFSPDFEKALLDFGFSEFTEIQQKCIPLAQQGKDIIGLAYTGSGKTIAFGFPTLEKVVPGKGIQLLVLVPTRELCNQVTKEFRKFTKYRKLFIVEVYGGVSIGPQIDHLRNADVVVSTPGRFLDHLSRGTLDTSSIRMLVLDEADKMFEMGFIDDLRQILASVPRNSQKLLFSATMPTGVVDIAKRFMSNPEKINAQAYVDKSKLVQYYYDVERNDKFSLLAHIIKTNSNGLILIFCGTRHFVDIVSKNLNRNGIAAKALHGGMRQGKRNEVMEAFRGEKLDVLVASDVAARGLDIKNVNLVVNFDIPKTSLEYIHRIGRTARAGSEGKVVSLLSSEDYDNFTSVLKDSELSIQKLDTPEFEHLAFVRPQQRRGGRFQGGRFPGRFQGHSRFQRGRRR